MKPEGDHTANWLTCPDNRAAVGFFGRFSSRVDSIGLLCDRELDLSLPTISSVTVDPTSVVGGTVVRGSVRLSRRSPNAGTEVSLAISGTFLGYLPVARLVIPQGEQSASFDINTLPVPVPSTMFVTATSPGSQAQNANLTIVPPTIDSIVFNPATVTGGTPVVATIRLNGHSPGGAFSRAVSNNSPQVALVPANFSVAFPIASYPYAQPLTINTEPTASDRNVTLTAGSYSRTFQVLAPRIQTFTVTPQILTPGQTATGAVTLTGRAPVGGGSATTLQMSMVNTASANTAVATVAGMANVTGDTAVNFPITAANVQAPACTLITTTFNNQARAYVGVAPSQAALVISGPPVVTFPYLGSGTVSLRNMQPSRQTYTLTSSNPGFVLSSTSVSVPALGNASFTVTLQSDSCSMVTATSPSGARQSVLVIAGPANIGG